MNAMRRLSVRTTTVLTVGAIAVALACQLWMQATFREVRHPVALGPANLEPDPGVVREWYGVLVEQGTYLQMIRTELVDSVWATSLAIATWLLPCLFAALLRRRSPDVSAFLLRWSPLFALAGVLDLVENGISLVMLTDPWGFPDVLAPLHAGVSVAKLSAAIATPVVGLSLSAYGAIRGDAARMPGIRRTGARMPVDVPNALPSR